MKILSLLLVSFLILFASCKSEFDVEYRIQNNSGKIVYVSGELNIDGAKNLVTTPIDTLSGIIIGSVSGTDQSTESYLDDINELINSGIVNLYIRNSDSTLFRRDPLDPAIWKTIDPVGSEETGFIVLDLNSADFL